MSDRLFLKFHKNQEGEKKMSVRDLMTEYLKAHPAATSMEVTRYVHEKQGKAAPTFPLSGSVLKQVKEGLGIKVQKKKRKGPGRPEGSKSEKITTTEASEPKERREYKRKTQRLYYSLWECSLEGISSSSERDLVDKLKDFIETLNNVRHTKFELLEIGCPRRIEIREGK